MQIPTIHLWLHFFRHLYFSMNIASLWLFATLENFFPSPNVFWPNNYRNGWSCMSTMQAFLLCTTLFHFLVISRRFSPWPRAFAWHPLRLAKRWQPPSRRSRWLFQHSDFFIQTNPSADWRPGGEAFCLFRVFSGLQKIRVHLCSFVVPD